MALTPGTRIGVYDITAPLGEGGMGQVWRALGQPQSLFRGLLDEPPHNFDIANAGRGSLCC